MRAPLMLWYGLPWNDPPQPEEAPRPRQPADPSRAPPLHALVMGRFNPPHRGHQYLVDCARGLAREVTVLVRVTDRDDIDGQHRLAWCEEIFPGVRVARLHEPEHPVPQDEPLLAWAGAVRRTVTGPPVDLVVTGEARDIGLARALGAGVCIVDPERTAVPISSTAIRAHPLHAWGFLPDVVRAHYARRVVVVGAEGTGKTTLARGLAAALWTTWIPEALRIMSGMKRPAELADFVEAAELQAATAAAGRRHCHRLLVCDTDEKVIAAWARRLCGGVPPVLESLAEASRPDLYVELPIPDEQVPSAPPARVALAQEVHDRIIASGVPVVTVRGTAEERLDQAVRIVAERFLV